MKKSEGRRKLKRRLKKDKEERIVQAKKAWDRAQSISQHKNHTAYFALRTIHKITPNLLMKNRLEKWGNLDLNQGPAGYEGGRLSYYPITSSHYEQDDKWFMAKMLLDFIGF